MYRQFNNSTFCPHTVFMCFVWIWEQTAIISLYSINWLVCKTETECVYCAVRTGSLNQTDSLSSFGGLPQKYTQRRQETHQTEQHNDWPTSTPRCLTHNQQRRYACSKQHMLFTAHKQTHFNLRPNEKHGLPSQRRFSANSHKWPTAWCASPLVPNLTQIWQWLLPVWAEIHLLPSVTSNFLHTDFHTTQRQLDVLYIILLLLKTLYYPTDAQIYNS